MSVDLISFREWIKKSGIVTENNLPYFIMWIRRYMDEGFSCEDQYSEVLCSEGRADWQIRQALNAVRLFHQYSGSGVEPAEECALGNPLDVLETKLRIRHYSFRTVKVYVYWCRDFLEYCRECELDSRSDSAYGDYLTMLALKRRVASSTQNQAFNALLFLFRNVWNREPEGIDAFRARKPKRLPVVLSREEVRSVLAGVSGVAGIVIKLCYSSGLRLSEALALRVKDVSLDRKLIVVRSGKGGKDRVTILADNMVPVLSDRLSVVKDICARSFYPVSLPSAIHRKYSGAGSDFRWWYLFPSKNTCSDGGMKVVHHIHSTSVQSEMRRAVKQSGIGKRAGVHTLRHCFATHLLQSGVELCEIQELLGHKNLETTRIYIHLAKDLGNTVRSPLDMIY